MELPGGLKNIATGVLPGRSKVASKDTLFYHFTISLYPESQKTHFTSHSSDNPQLTQR